MERLKWYASNLKSISRCLGSAVSDLKHPVSCEEPTWSHPHPKHKQAGGRRHALYGRICRRGRLRPIAMQSDDRLAYRAYPDPRQQTRQRKGLSPSRTDRNCCTGISYLPPVLSHLPTDFFRYFKPQDTTPRQLESGAWDTMTQQALLANTDSIITTVSWVKPTATTITREVYGRTKT